MSKKSLALWLLLWAVPAHAQQRVNGLDPQLPPTAPMTPATAIAVRCVDITGTVFEACGGGGAGGGLTDIQLRATPVPISGFPTTVGTAVSVRCVDITGTTFEACGGTGGSVANQKVNISQTGTENDVDANITNASIAVTGTFWPATQPVSGTFFQATQPVSGTFWQATQPVSGTFWQATQPVSGSITQIPDVNIESSAPAGTTTVTSYTVALAGRQAVGGELRPTAWSGTFTFEYSSNNQTTWSSAIVVLGGGQVLSASIALTLSSANQDFHAVVGEGWTHFRLRIITSTAGTYSANVTATQLISPLAVGALNMGTNGGVLPFWGGLIAASTGTVEAFLQARNASPTNTDYGLYIRNTPTPTTLVITTKSAANTTVTATLPAVAAVFHYITFIQITRTCTTAIAGTAVLDYTTTNLPGTLAWSAGNACAVGSSNQDVMMDFSAPIKSLVVNTATTIVAPAAGATGIVRITVGYYTGL